MHFTLNLVVPFYDLFSCYLSLITFAVKIIENLCYLYSNYKSILLHLGTSQAEKLVKACSAIVADLITAVEQGKDVNLNGLKQRHARALRLQSQPRLVDIIAAVPPAYKSILLPRLRAKPIRTASGVS